MNWQIASYVMGGVGGLATLVMAMREKPRDLPRLRSYWWFLPLLLIWTGDAVLGDARPAYERIGKGLVAGVFWLSVAVVVWRRRRHRAALTE